MSYRFIPNTTTRLDDSSWIKHRNDVDEDSNSMSDNTTTQTSRTMTSVKALTNKFGGGQDDSWSSTSPTSRTSSSTTTRVTKNGTTETTTTTTTKNLSSPTRTFTERVRNSSQGPQYSTYSPTRTTKVTDTAITSSKDAEDELYNTLIPTSLSKSSSTTYSPSKVTEITYTTNKSGEDKLYDTDIPSTVKDILSPTDRNQYSNYSSSKTTTVTTVTTKGAEDVTDLTPYKDDFKPTDSSKLYSTTETVTVKTSPYDNEDIKTTTLTRTSSKPVDDLYSNLLPIGITSLASSSDSSTIRKKEIITVESSRRGEDQSPSSSWRTSSYSSYDDSPSTVTTSYSTSTTPSDTYSRETTTNIYSKPSPSYEYTSPTSYSSSLYRRTVLEKDLCTICRKPLSDDPKMVLDDMKIRCHASCFKCDVCNSTLGNLKAGDSLWMYRNMVHCENCFEVTRDKWHR